MTQVAQCLLAHGSLTVVRSFPHCSWSVYSRARQTFEVVLAHQLHLGWRYRMQRNFEPMRKQVEAWQRFELTDITAKVVIYEAFVEGMLEAPKHLAHGSRLVFRTQI